MARYLYMNMDKSEKANIGQFRERVSAYMTKVEKGEKVVVCRRNQPVAELVPVGKSAGKNQTRLGSAKGSVAVKCDLTAPAIPAKDWEGMR
jgi:antitoxin (DNA-binding transcriptional repressor) of toxin-antitoxin stability system